VDLEGAAIDKQFGDPGLEVGCINRFLERETMSHVNGKLGILSTNELALCPPPASAPADDTDGHRVEQHHWDHESGSVSTHAHIWYCSSQFQLTWC
jgi:hypothetical protein